MKKKLLWILTALGFFSLSRGLWYNFQSLWLQNNGLSIATISTVTSLASLASVSIMILLFDFVTKKRLKNFIAILLFLKIITLFALFELNDTNLYMLIKFLIMFDIVIDTEISISIYPLLSLFHKDNQLYNKKDIIASTFYDFGVLFGSIFLGKTLFFHEVTFNIFLLFSIICACITFTMIVKLKPDLMEQEETTSKHILLDILHYIKKDKISKNYLGYVLVGNISYNIITGLKMLLLTSILLYSPNDASYFLLFISIASDFTAMLILKKFTFKNNFTNYLIKFGGRFMFYVIAFISQNKICYLIALSYAILFTNSYSHVTEAPFINLYSKDYQLAFCNLRNMASYLAQALGIAICGLAFAFDIHYIFLIAAILVVYQIILGYRATKLKENEKASDVI